MSVGEVVFCVFIGLELKLGVFFWGFRVFDFEGGGGVGVVDLVVNVGYGVFLEVECGC